MAKTKVVQLNIDDLKSFLTHIVNNNRYLQKNGKIPAAVEVVGNSGIGKTSTVLQLGEELGLDVVKLNLAQIEELGDLIGFPIRQFEISKSLVAIDQLVPDYGVEDTNDSIDLKWVDENVMDEYRAIGYKSTGRNRMSYCPPQWIADKTAGGILILDDWNRADTRFIQAVMELIDRQQYISWSLPKDWHILLTSNPDDGEYMVNSIDDAQKTRFISADLKFDIDCWARWAENSQIDTRCINFMLMHPELVTKGTNARSITTFFNSISSLGTFESSLPLIQLCGEGSVGDEFSSMFVLFINNKLDKLISPKEMLLGSSTDSVINTLKKTIGSGSSYRADISSVIATRMINYSLFHAESNPVDKKMIERIETLITEDVFANDLKFHIVRKIYTGNMSKFKTIIMNQKLNGYITS